MEEIEGFAKWKNKQIAKMSNSKINKPYWLAVQNILMCSIKYGVEEQAGAIKDLWFKAV